MHDCRFVILLQSLTVTTQAFPALQQSCCQTQELHRVCSNKHRFGSSHSVAWSPFVHRRNRKRCHHNAKRDSRSAAETTRCRCKFLSITRLCRQLFVSFDTFKMRGYDRKMLNDYVVLPTNQNCAYILYLQHRLHLTAKYLTRLAGIQKFVLFLFFLFCF